MSLVTPNSFFHAPNNNDSDNSNTTIIFFITGNPGLIAYYHTFLSLLSSKLAGSGGNCGKFQIYGHSLAGFELPSEADAGAEAGGEKQQEDDYCNLEEQVRFVQRGLDEFITRHDNNPPGSEGNQPQRHKVILIGHSVGSYIAMEVLQRHRERQKKAQSDSAAAEADFDIIGGVMLFPTVVDIAKSPSGEKLSKLLYLIPQLALVASFFARLLTALVPGGLLRSIVATFMGLSLAQADSSAVVDTTCAFLKSKRGVRQALHLGADEMQTITSDKWSDDIWGIPSVQEPLTKLFFYFGRNDHWVAERTRDEIIAVRGRVAQGGGEEGPTMMVCEDGLPHAFCLRYNEAMATKTADMIQAIVQGQE